jgi:aspartyl-tRNA(Asn)/glutamyl-tRNA(Gln) amidotransferase subunit A
MSPTAYCGITGLRPTWGLVSRYGAMELAWSMDKIGPMARSAEDCGWILQTLAGYDANDSTTSVRGFRFSSRTQRRDFRLGVLPADFSDAPEIEKAFEDALRVLHRAGMKIALVDLPDLPYAETTRTILNGETAAAFQNLIKSKRLEELVDVAQKKGLRRNLKLTAVELLNAQRKRELITREVLQLFERFDALVAPAAVNVAPTLDTNLQKMIRKRGNYSMLGALCGVPALSLPMGFGRQGLPLGLCLTGNLWSENAILQIGMIYQRETDWHRRKPILKDIQ